MVIISTTTTVITSTPMDVDVATLCNRETMAIPVMQITDTLMTKIGTIRITVDRLW